MLVMHKFVVMTPIAAPSTRVRIYFLSQPPSCDYLLGFTRVMFTAPNGNPKRNGKIGSQRVHVRA